MDQGSQGKFHWHFSPHWGLPQSPENSSALQESSGWNPEAKLCILAAISQLSTSHWPAAPLPVPLETELSTGRFTGCLTGLATAGGQAAM